MSRPWFCRVWVIQEFALPGLVTMLCGEWTMDATIPGVIMMLFRMIGIAHLACDIEDPIANAQADRGIVLLQEHLRLRLRFGNKSGLMGENLAAQWRATLQ